MNRLTLMNPIPSTNNIRLSDLKPMFRLCRNDRANTYRIAAEVRAKSRHRLVFLSSTDGLFAQTHGQE